MCRGRAKILTFSVNVQWMKVRRGADKADIYSLAFSTTAERLAVSSDRGTVQVFNLKVDSEPLGIERSQSAAELNNATSPVISHLSFMKGKLQRRNWGRRPDIWMRRGKKRKLKRPEWREAEAKRKHLEE